MRFRLPDGVRPASATVDGRPVAMIGDTVVIDARGGGRFEVAVGTS